MENLLSFEYIRGLVEGEGSFTFSTTKYVNKSGDIIINKIRSFIIGMHERDEVLLNMVKETLGIRNKVYRFNPRVSHDVCKRGGMVVLTVREFGQLKNIIVPFFYNRLKGNKGKQFIEWLEKIGSDPEVSEHFRFIYKIYKSGFYDRNQKFID